MQFLKHDDPRGWGVFVASKGKVSLLLDRNRDDQCDEEIIVAQGWDEIVQNVDAVGLATDATGALYFRLGTANYANAYLVDDQGNSKYDIKSDRGTIQKISPDFSKRETICTGVRFPIGIAFHPNGDLFCTDQEGATWLPNGNPFDELLHIITASPRAIQLTILLSSTNPLSLTTVLNTSRPADCSSIHRLTPPLNSVPQLGPITQLSAANRVANFGVRNW